MCLVDGQLQPVCGADVQAERDGHIPPAAAAHQWHRSPGGQCRLQGVPCQRADAGRWSRVWVG